jgi:hypothetical protein
VVFEKAGQNFVLKKRRALRGVFLVLTLKFLSNFFQKVRGVRGNAPRSYLLFTNQYKLISE